MYLDRLKRKLMWNEMRNIAATTITPTKCVPLKQRYQKAWCAPPYIFPIA